MPGHVQDTGGHSGSAPALLLQRHGNALAMHGPYLPRVSLHLGTRSPRRADGSWAQLPFRAAVCEEGPGAETGARVWSEIRAALGAARPAVLRVPGQTGPCAPRGGPGG